MGMRSKADISNHAIRVFLQDVGKFYDEARGFKKFIPSTSQKKDILNFFKEKCCFCNKKISIEDMHQDHLIPMNKTSLGLHAWGNVVPCCRECNAKKHRKDWQTYLKSISSSKDLAKRKRKIKSFVKRYKYKPNLNIKEIVNNLYQDVGEVSKILIQLRYKQAEEIIKKVI